MKKSIVLIVLILSIHYISLNAQKILNATHRLEMLREVTTTSIIKDVTIETKLETIYLSAEFSQSYLTAQIIQAKSDEYKFQFSEIKNNELINIHFNGLGKVSNQIVGKYTTYVDGNPRKDLSGTFTITKISK